MKIKKPIFFALILAILQISGCSYFTKNQPEVQQGNILKPYLVDKIHPGDSEAQVLSILGSPVLVNTFDTAHYNYVYTYARHFRSFVENKVIITFSHGRVAQVEKNISVETTY